jgi:hypothetical protein
MKPLPNCHDCGIKPGQAHKPGCDIERCSSCGQQKLGCECEDHDPLFARWTGVWPGYAEARELGLFTKWTDKGWQKCYAFDPEAKPDLNTFYEKGLNKIFFVKPKHN